MSEPDNPKCAPLSRILVPEDGFSSGNVIVFLQIPKSLYQTTLTQLPTPHFSPCVKSFLGDSDSFSEHTPSQRWIHPVSDLGRRKNKTFSAQLLQLLFFLQCKLQSKQLPGISNGNVLLVCPCRQIITMTLLRTSICCLLPFRPSYAQVPSFFYASLSWICYL